MPPPSKTIYHSFQQNFVIGKNGVPHGSATVVDIRNGKGTKSKVVYDGVSERKKPRRMTKRLTSREIQQITANTFVPKLFSFRSKKRNRTAKRRGNH